MMKMVFVGAAAVVALASGAGPAFAATSYASAYDAGHCLVQRDRARAVALLQALPLGDGPASLPPRLACAAGFDGAPAMVVRGAIAQALYFADRHNYDAGSLVPLLDIAVPTEASARGGDALTELYRWGDCVVRNDLEGTWRLLRSGVGSPDETAATAALTPLMGRCLPSGAQLSVRPWQLRAILAQSNYENFYRMMTGQLSVRR